MKVLITGAAGFIGSHLSGRFTQIGWNVTAVDKDEADVTSDEIAARIFEGQFDAIVHLAAQTDVRASVRSPAHDALTNILGTINVVEAVARLSPETRIVFASSGGAVYGDSPASESTAKLPRSPYGLSKLAAEQYLAYFQRAFGISAIALRLGNVYGPGQASGVVPTLCRRFLAGKPLSIYGDGLQTRDFVFVDDVVRAFEIAVTSKTGGAVNIATGEGTTVRALAEIVGAKMEFLPARAGEQEHSRLDITRAQLVLGWHPQVGLATGLLQALDWYSRQTSQGEEWRTQSASSA